MASKELTKNDVSRIVKDEIKSYLNNQFEVELKKALKKGNSGAKKEITSIVKDALNSLYQFMYIKRSVWNNDIK